MRDDQAGEEVLECVWTAREQGTALRDLDGAGIEVDPAAALAAARRAGWIVSDDDRITLTPAGEERAAGVIRRHRLAERLLFDVIQVDSTAMEAGACELEHAHVLSDEATDRICAFLGHPPTCPHERPIPRGRCCDRFTRDVRPLVTPLAEGTVGMGYRIVFVASRSHRRLERLCQLGVAPGQSLHLQQRLPALVVRLGETEIALDAEIAADVFVVPA